MQEVKAVKQAIQWAGLIQNFTDDKLEQPENLNLTFAGEIGSVIKVLWESPDANYSDEDAEADQETAKQHLLKAFRAYFALRATVPENNPEAASHVIESALKATNEAFEEPIETAEVWLLSLLQTRSYEGLHNMKPMFQLAAWLDLSFRSVIGSILAEATLVKTTTRGSRMVRNMEKSRLSEIVTNTMVGNMPCEEWLDSAVSQLSVNRPVLKLIK